MSVALQDANRHNAGLQSPNTKGVKSPARLGHAQRTPKKHGGGVLAVANNRMREQATPGRNFSGNLSMGGANVPPPLVVESQRYEEWMKIATDNKITSTNTWNLALIDYFHDMSLLRNGDDNSINFQKASCTLDGCVKIWTSRVDSVATETGKLLSGLAEDGRASNDADDDDMDSGDDEAREARKNKRKTARQAATLAEDFSKIKVKAFDLEFTVDPLFKKTSADFDEGGAGGILMNHLGCDGNMKVVFDAGDAKLENNEDDESEDEDEDEDMIKVDLTKLTSKFLPSLDAFSTMTLCPSLASFRFSPDANIDLGILNPVDDEAPLHNAHLADDEDDFGGAGEDVFAGVDFGGGGDEGAVDFFDDGVEDGSGPGNGQVEDFDPRRLPGERDLVMSMDGNGEQMFDYFDSALMKNWAGPEHWKMRRVAVRKEDATTATAKQRKEKTAFSIDFSAPPLLSQKELFAAGPATAIRTARKSSVAPSARSRRSSRPAPREDTYVLPDDFHFSSQLLLRLFLKPKTALKMRRRTPAEGEPDAQFWAPGGVGLAGDEDMGGMGDYFPGDDGGDDDDHAPFATQFMADDEDDVPYFDDEDPDDLISATQGQLQRVRPENVNYAKRAKRVDVKKLKDSIWHELEEVTIPVKDFPVAAAYAPEMDKPEALVPVITGLRKMYPKDKMEEISTSFCFICLLHLANEQGLRIQTPQAEGGEVDDGLLARTSVGGLEQLRVFREIAA